LKPEHTKLVQFSGNSVQVTVFVSNDILRPLSIRSLEKITSTIASLQAIAYSQHARSRMSQSQNELKPDWFLVMLIPSVL